jgi:hypothetical protein
LAILINPWWWTAVGAVIAFWAGPFTPAIVLQAAFIVFVKKIFDKIKNKKEIKDYD